MAKVDFESFAEKEVSRIYIAARLPEARQVESTLTENDIDYAVEIEPYFKVVLNIFPFEYPGATFYVLFGQAQFARQALLKAGLKAGLVDEEAV
jgi:hypothetical protein